ncbi:MAG: T9SS type A sorting domain-containing protein [Flavobacteriales bacterium]|nr:T9SS type A sorting domain-containing protein [Flavobacteriales bacterium]
MKRSTALFALIATAVASFAQIPNAGFEAWTNMGTYNTPDGWGNLNATTAVANVYTCTKATPGNPGTAYMKLTSKTVAGVGVAPGIAVSGALDQSTFLPTSGFAFDQRPQSLTGNWQYMAFGNDQGHIAVYLTKWNTGTNQRETVASAMHDLVGMAMSWAPFTISLTYTSTEAPDSALIVLAASGDTPVNNSYLWVDNLAFSGTVTGIQEAGQLVTNVQVFPNPATDVLVVSGARWTNAKVLDLQGRSMLSVQLNAGKLDVSTLPAGLYVVRLTDATGKEGMARFEKR